MGSYIHTDFSTLLPSIILIFFVCFIICYRVTRSPITSVGIVIVKLSLYIYYFLFSDTFYSFEDDVVYYKTSRTFYEHGYRLTTMFYDALHGWTAFVDRFGTDHIFYQIYNILSFQVLGVYYFAPVAFNIILTCAIGMQLYKFIVLSNGDKGFAKIAFLFFVLHWDTLSWSSFLNLKDFLVEFMAITAIYNIVLIFKHKQTLRNYLYLIFCIFVLLYLRYYIPAMLLSSAFIYWLYSKIFVLKRRIYLLISMFLVPAALYLILFTFGTSLKAYQLYFDNPLIGIFRYWITPVPFQISEGAGFQTIAAYFNWLFLPAFFVGLYQCIKRPVDPTIRYLVIYFLLLSLFYGTFELLQGPRHRIHLEFIIVYFQLIGIRYIFKTGFRKKNRTTGVSWTQ